MVLHWRFQGRLQACSEHRAWFLSIPHAGVTSHFSKLGKVNSYQSKFQMRRKIESVGQAIEIPACHIRVLVLALLLILACFANECPGGRWAIIDGVLLPMAGSRTWSEHPVPSSQPQPGPVHCCKHLGHELTNRNSLCPLVFVHLLLPLCVSNL